MKSYVADVDGLTADEAFHLGHRRRLVLMVLRPGQVIGAETHSSHDQFSCVEKGHGQIVIDGEIHEVATGFAIVVPAGAFHDLRNTSAEPIRLYGLAKLRRSPRAEHQGTSPGSHEAFEGATTE